MAILIFFVAHWYLSLFTQSFLNHRYAAHNAFTMNVFWERVFYVLAFIFQGASYMSPRTYAIMHRIHHAYTDTEKDPHSPAFDKNLFAMMWRSKTTYTSIYRGVYNVEPRFMKNLTSRPFIDKIAHSWTARVFWGLFYIAFYVYFAPSPWLYLLIPVHIFMGPVHGVIINWFAHKTGSVNFKMNNTSKNLFPVDLLMLGEGYHNNHHMHPSRANFGVKRSEIDPIYPFILLFNWLGVIQLGKKPALAGIGEMDAAIPSEPVPGGSSASAQQPAAEVKSEETVQ